ncbi:secretion protein HlyD [Arenibaculum pallidiluteum]|uniref:secretion protein HlyD n=1 Tax=Arenibaculum pallidiluteum TaxID=2812559 RepID=UPI001A96644A|nr:secretion protein HlyD [Arenibaculum pallidiluteum]
MRRRLAAALALLVAAGGIVAWRLDLPARLGWRERPAAGLTLYGNVDIRQVQLGFRVSGRIAGMAVDEGDRVVAGTELARLDPRPYEDGRRAAAAQAAGSAATLARLEAGPRKAEIAQAAATLAEREADLANAVLALERARQLALRGTAPEAALDQARAAKEMAAARVASAQAALRLLEEGSRSEDIAFARAELQAAEANLSAADTQLQDTLLQAPAEGVVLSRVREPGAIVSPGDAVYVVSLDRPVWVRAYVAEPDLGRIHPGLTVEVVTDTAPDRPYRGRVGFISPVAEFTPKSVETPELRTDLVYRLRVVVENADAALRQGMPVTLRVPAEDPATPAGRGP